MRRGGESREVLEVSAWPPPSPVYFLDTRSDDVYVDSMNRPQLKDSGQPCVLWP